MVALSGPRAERAINRLLGAPQFQPFRPANTSERPAPRG